MRPWITLALFLAAVALLGLLSYEAVSWVWSWFRMRPGIVGWTIICLPPGILTLAGGALFTSWFSRRNRTLPARLWRDGKIVEALQEAARRGDVKWIPEALRSLAPHHVALRDQLILAVTSVVLLRGDATDARNPYIPMELKAETMAHADRVLDGLFAFCHRLHLLESRGLRLVEGETAPALAALATTTRQSNEARTALGQLTLGNTSPQIDRAASLVKSITWQARELTQLNRDLEK